MSSIRTKSPRIRPRRRPQLRVIAPELDGQAPQSVGFRFEHGFGARHHYRLNVWSMDQFARLAEWEKPVTFAIVPGLNLIVELHGCSEREWDDLADIQGQVKDLVAVEAPKRGRRP